MKKEIFIWTFSFEDAGFHHGKFLRILKECFSFTLIQNIKGFCQKAPIVQIKMIQKYFFMKHDLVLKKTPQLLDVFAAGNWKFPVEIK